MLKNIPLLHFIVLITPIIAFMLACSLLAPVPTATLPGPPPAVTGFSPEPAAPFTGTWTSTDTDGSNQELIISGGAGGIYTISYTDLGASACGKDAAGNPIYAASATGNLTASGNDLSGTLAIYCQKNPATLLTNYGFHYYYDSSVGTMTDDFGVVWYRK